MANATFGDDVTTDQPITPHFSSNTTEIFGDYFSTDSPENISDYVDNDFYVTNGPYGSIPPTTFVIFASPQYFTATAVIIILCSFVSAIGNSIVMGIIICKPALQTVTHLLIVNLATSHLVSSVFCSPILAVVSLTQGYWTMGVLACKVVHFSELVLSSSASLTLSAIAIDRYFSVVYHMNQKIITKFKGKIIIFFIWLLSVVICLPKVFVLDVVKDDYDKYTCADRIHEKFRPDVFTVCYFTFTTFIPVLISCFAYVFVWRTFRLSQRRVKKSHKRRHNSLQHALPYASKTEIRLLKMLFIMVFCFILFRAPWTVVSFHAQFVGTPLPEYTVLTAQWFLRLQLVIDPIVYGYLNKTFRKSLCEVCLLCPLCGPKCQPPSTVDSPKKDAISSNKQYSSAGLKQRVMPNVIHMKTDESGKVSMLNYQESFKSETKSIEISSSQSDQTGEKGGKKSSCRTKRSSVILNDVIHENADQGGSSPVSNSVESSGQWHQSHFETIMEYHNMEYTPLSRTFDNAVLNIMNHNNSLPPPYRRHLPPIEREEKPRKKLKKKGNYLKKLARRKRNSVGDSCTEINKNGERSSEYENGEARY